MSKVHMKARDGWVEAEITREVETEEEEDAMVETLLRLLRKVNTRAESR